MARKGPPGGFAVGGVDSDLSQRMAALSALQSPRPRIQKAVAAPRGQSERGGTDRAAGPRPRSARGALALARLPDFEFFGRAALCRVHRLVVARVLGGQLDDIAVRVAEIDRVDDPVIGNATRLDAGRLALFVHLPEVGMAHLERDVKIVIMLRLEIEGHVR